MQKLEVKAEECLRPRVIVCKKRLCAACVSVCVELADGGVTSDDPAARLAVC